MLVAHILAEVFRSKNKTQINPSVKFYPDPSCPGPVINKTIKYRKGPLNTPCTPCTWAFVWINEGNKRQPQVSRAGTVTQSPQTWLCEGDRLHLLGDEEYQKEDVRAPESRAWSHISDLMIGRGPASALCRLRPRLARRLKMCKIKNGPRD